MSAPASRIARAFLVVLIAAAALLVAAPSAMAETCVDRMLDDWSADGRVDKTYPIDCYDRTLEEMPRDLYYYSNAPDAVLAAKERYVGRPATPAGVPSGDEGDPSAPGGSGNDSGEDGDGDGGPVSGLLNAGPSAADDVPLPLLILALVALALMGAGAAGLISRRLQARRAPAGESPPDDPGTA